MLEGANLVGADLRGADLRGAKLKNAVLMGAMYDRTTRWPFLFGSPEHKGAVNLP